MGTDRETANPSPNAIARNTVPGVMGRVHIIVIAILGLGTN